MKCPGVLFCAMSRVRCSLPHSSEQLLYITTISFAKQEDEGPCGRVSLSFPELQICLNGATRDKVVINAERKLLAKYVGGQRQLQAYDEAPQKLSPLPTLLAQPCAHASPSVMQRTPYSKVAVWTGERPGTAAGLS